MVQRFASNVYECILDMAHKWQLEYVVDAVASFVRHHRRNQQVFCQEAVMWRHLTHPNILPLLGVTVTPTFQLISNWMPGGDLPGYIEKNPNADRLELVGVPPAVFIPCLLRPLPAIRRCEGPLLPPLLQRGSR